MLYVQQSLGSDEELVHIGKFHWMYTVSSASWVAIGLILCFGILWGAIYYDIVGKMSASSGLTFFEVFSVPDDKFDASWAFNVEKSGGYFSIIQSTHPAVRICAFLAFLMGLYMFVQMMVVKATTEIAITNNRLIYKQGLIARHVGEISIDRIEGVNVLQGILGRLLGYGHVIVRGMGVGEVMLPPIADPVKFRMAIDKARTL
jgi:hypothetical protein